MGSNLNTVLTDLYRLGIIGNYSPASKLYRWQHKGDDGLIIADDWKIMIHSALQSALSVNRRHDRTGISSNDGKTACLKCGDLVDVRVTNIYKSFANVQFERNGKIYKGSIHISQLSNEYTYNVSDRISIGDEFQAKVVDYNEEHRVWMFTLKN